MSNKNNNKQNIDIAHIQERLIALEERFEHFVNNEFLHLRTLVDKITWTIVIGFLTTIVTILLTKVL